MSSIPNIRHLLSNSNNPIIDSVDSDFELPFYKYKAYFDNMDNFVRFVKNVEKLVRMSDEYKRYVKYIKVEVGVNFCQVLSGIIEDVDEDSPAPSGNERLLEMHHGPLLTLFDVVSVVTDYMIFKGEKITSFSVADVVIQEHFDHNIQVVMLSESVHEQVHQKTVFLSLSHGLTNVVPFMKKYEVGFSYNLRCSINDYIEKSKKYGTMDNGVLDVAKELANWNFNEQSSTNKFFS